MPCHRSTRPSPTTPTSASAGRGATLAEALANAGRALTAVVTDPGSIREVLSVEIACESADPEVLLFDWLNALVFEMATRHVLFGRYDVRVDGASLVARAFGEPVEVARHQPGGRGEGGDLDGDAGRARGRDLGRRVRGRRVTGDRPWTSPC